MATKHELTAEVSQLVIALAEHVREAFDIALRTEGLTAPQLSLLRALVTNDDVPQRVLASRLGCDSSNVVGLVDRLEHARLVTRGPDPADRRIKRVALTDDGRAAAGRVWDHAVANTPVRSLTAAQLQQMCSLLRLVLNQDQACQVPSQLESRA